MQVEITATPRRVFLNEASLIQRLSFRQIIEGKFSEARGFPIKKQASFFHKVSEEFSIYVYFHRRSYSVARDRKSKRPVNEIPEAQARPSRGTKLNPIFQRYLITQQVASFFSVSVPSTPVTRPSLRTLFTQSQAFARLHVYAL